MSPHVPEDTSIVEGGPVVEGGLITNKDLQQGTVKGPFDVEKHRGRITVLLLALLALIIVGHYLGILIMVWNGKNVETLSNVFHVALPTVAGLTGTAIAYYFTRSRE
jgi:hypothetical protein